MKNNNYVQKLYDSYYNWISGELCRFILVQKGKKIPTLSEKGLTNVDINYTTKVIREKGSYYEFIEQGYNIGLVAGDDLIIIDVDDKDLGRELLKISDTLVIETRRGFHFYYRRTESYPFKNKMKIDKGKIHVDLITGNNYVLVPGSVVIDENGVVSGYEIIIGREFNNWGGDILSWKFFWLFMIENVVGVVDRRIIDISPNNANVVGVGAKIIDLHPNNISVK